jgi:hypothetical protein
MEITRFILSKLGEYLGVQYPGTDVVDGQAVEHEERMRRYFAESELRPLPWQAEHLDGGKSADKGECLICGQPRDLCDCTWHAPI